MPSALCSPIPCQLTTHPFNHAQGFGKRKNQFGMRRPKKAKVEASEGDGAGTLETFPFAIAPEEEQ